MVIQNLLKKDINSDSGISSSFLSIYNDQLKLNCKIYNGNFYCDSFNFFPITPNNYSFLGVFLWGEKSRYTNFFTKEFYSYFNKKKKDFKKFNDVIILGSSVSDNYYRNLITFLPRIFFISDKKINLAIHRNTSNKFRNFLKKILVSLEIKLNKFIYLDDDFYFFNKSQIPQFFYKKHSIQILNQLLAIKNIHKTTRLYVTRKNASSRKIINESDLIDILKSKNFQIIDTDNMEINEQIKIFSSAEIVISSTGSALANIVFCKEGTKILEIRPKYTFDFEDKFKKRYSNICDQLNLIYYSLDADPIKNEKINKNLKKNKFINADVIKYSNYYKNLLVKKNKFIKLIDQF